MLSEPKRRDISIVRSFNDEILVNNVTLHKRWGKASSTKKTHLTYSSLGIGAHHSRLCSQRTSPVLWNYIQAFWSAQQQPSPLVAVLIPRTIIIIVIPIISIATAIAGLSVAIAVYPAIIPFNGSIVACRNQVGRATTMLRARFTPAMSAAAFSLIGAGTIAHLPIATSEHTSILPTLSQARRWSLLQVMGMRSSRLWHSSLCHSCLCVPVFIFLLGVI